jgi:hypothetical protein
LANRKIDGRFVKLRWHILLAIRYYVCGESVPSLSSPRVEKSAKAIREFIEDGSDTRISELNDLCAAIVEIDDMTRDKVRSSALTTEVKTRALALRKKSLATKTR